MLGQRGSSIAVAPSRNLIGALVVALVLLASVIQPQPVGAGAVPAYDQIGVVGCSHTEAHVRGYSRVTTQNRFWPARKLDGFSGATLGTWASGNPGGWATFSANLATYGADAVWYQICINVAESSDTGITQEQMDNLTTVLATIEDLAPGADLYVSPVHSFADPACYLSGDYGVPNAVDLADWAAAEGLALRGPTTGPLEAGMLKSDLCHLSRTGENFVGQQLVDFFDVTGPAPTPPSLVVTAPSEGATVAGSVTITADASDDDGVGGVDFFVDGQLLFADTQPPYEATWDATSAGSGTHTISVIATDTLGASSQASIDVIVDNPGAPVAVIGDGSGSTMTAEVGVAVSFDGSASFDTDGVIVDHAWDFGDGGVGSGAVADHTYASAGTFTVTLTVTDDGGLVDSTAVEIIVDGGEPLGIIVETEAPLMVGEPITFTDGSNPALFARKWIMGDGGVVISQSSPSISYVYSDPGTYVVTLRTQSPTGGRVTLSVEIVVEG